MAGEETLPELDGDLELQTEMDEGTTEDIEAMKQRLAEMEKEAAKLKEAQEKAQKEAGIAPGDASTSGSAAELAAKEEADARSVYVGNVDYAATPEELQSHFQGCGTVNRVTILTDRTGNPKGFAYIEFLEADAVTAACLLEGSELRGRALKVSPKRTNVPGMKAGRGRGRGRGGYGMMPPPFMMPWMWAGYMPSGGRGRGRGRGRGGFSPY